MYRTDLLDACKDIVTYNQSIRVVAENWGIAKTTLYNFIKRDLPYLDSQLYDEIKEKLNKHKKEIKRDRSGRFKKYN